MKTLIIGDLHIDESSIKEIDEIFSNDVFRIVAGRHFDRIIQVGDWFHNNRPTPLELKFSTQLINNLQIYFKEIIILSGTGEHDLLRGTSVVEHLEAFQNVKVIKGDYIDTNILYGHFMINESKLAFGTGKCGKKDLAKYKFVFLGHQHVPEQIENIYHLGSVRFVSFGEIISKESKHIAILEDDKLSFESLTRTIPMIDVLDVNQFSSIDARTKVRYVCNSFEDFRLNAAILNKLGKKFVQFKIKMNFKDSKNLAQSSIKVDSKTINKEQIIKSYLEKIEDKEVAKLLREVIDEN